MSKKWRCVKEYSPQHSSMTMAEIGCLIQVRIVGREPHRTSLFQGVYRPVGEEIDSDMKRLESAMQVYLAQLPDKESDWEFDERHEWDDEPTIPSECEYDARSDHVFHNDPNCLFGCEHRGVKFSCD